MSAYMGTPAATVANEATGYKHDRIRLSYVAPPCAATVNRFMPFRVGDTSFVGGPSNSGENDQHYAGGFGMGSSYSGGDVA